jgi:hypothetical protein
MKYHLFRAALAASTIAALVASVGAGTKWR